jgi:hypothetical protein
MESIVQTMQEQQAAQRKKLRGEFFALVSKPNPSAKDAGRLAEVTKQLGWTDKFARVVGEIISETRRTEEELKKPTLTEEDRTRLNAEFSNLMADWGKKAAEHNKAVEDLGVRIQGATFAIENRRRLQEYVDMLRSNFGPALNTGDQWGANEWAAPGQFQGHLRFLREQDPENAAPPYVPRR